MSATYQLILHTDEGWETITFFHTTPIGFTQAIKTADYYNAMGFGVSMHKFEDGEEVIRDLTGHHWLYSVNSSREFLYTPYAKGHVNEGKVKRETYWGGDFCGSTMMTIEDARADYSDKLRQGYTAKEKSND